MLSTGDQLGAYRLGEEIAQGGMARIFRAERVGAMGMSREVCIKCILPSLCRDEEFVRMFIDEARLSMTLRHSNIVAVEDFGLADEVPFMCMEWIHGVDASRMVKHLARQGSRLRVDDALFIVSEVLQALEYAHRKVGADGRWLEIVHRDVTPHNLMISFTGAVKLTDFGIARATSRLFQTVGPQVRGKMAYMAPEQATGGRLDRRTDLFAVGVMAYEFLAGQRPFVGRNGHEGVDRMLRGLRPSLRSLRPEVPEAVEAFVDRLLAASPDDRPADAGAARDELDQAITVRSGERSLQTLLGALFDDREPSAVATRFAPVDALPIGPVRARAPIAVAFPAARGGRAADTPARPSTVTPTVPSGRETPTTAPRTVEPAAQRTDTALAPTETAATMGPGHAAPRPAVDASAPVTLPPPTTAGDSIDTTRRRGLETEPPLAALPLLSGQKAATSLAATVVEVAPRPPVTPRARRLTLAITASAVGVLSLAGALYLGAFDASEGQTPPPVAVRGVTEPPPPPVAASVPPRATAVEPRPATLTVVALPRGHITVDGQPAEDRATFRVPPGRHVVVVRGPHRQRQELLVELGSAEVRTIEIRTR